MVFDIPRQEYFSRSELLLRSFFGWLYIAIPHFFLLFFAGIWSGILGFVAFWVVLFTGKYPQSMFEYQVKLMNWSSRVAGSINHLFDGYPSLGLEPDDKVTLEIPYPEKLSRGLVLLRTFFGIFYITIPHWFVLYFRLIIGSFLEFLAWWVVLFTGSYPESWHSFNVGTLRWMMRLKAYKSFLTDTYPKFSGKE
ncbi:DUF4389 domain-containing protein [Chitinispirillales bacterium ANBcel5]|uniref:DUF4389 domain-containing protein n=1 Tax=Cellulosispirillum alkaliphilum TaxID=3039283 RepID=UPI002A51B7F8|nr:DUF4389 domain-containing protein [Chitinispirillales bacterium ANBcel5]